MSGMIVGVKRAVDSLAPIGWAAAEADLRGLPVSLVHAWSEPLDLAVDLDPGALPGLVGGATSYAVHGPVVPALLARAPEMLVLGGRSGATHLSGVIRGCLRHAACPVVIVPRDERPAAGRVLAAVSWGEPSRAALRWAADEARRRAAQLVVVHAWQRQVASVHDLLQPDRTVPAQRDAAHDRLCAWVYDVLGDVDADVNAAYGGPLDALLHFGAGADLIVVGRAHHAGVGRALHGIVGNDIAGLAPCPVVFIPA